MIHQIVRIVDWGACQKQHSQFGVPSRFGKDHLLSTSLNAESWLMHSFMDIERSVVISCVVVLKNPDGIRYGQQRVIRCRFTWETEVVRSLLKNPECIPSYTLHRSSGYGETLTSLRTGDQVETTLKKFIRYCSASKYCSHTKSIVTRNPLRKFECDILNRHLALYTFILWFCSACLTEENFERTTLAVRR